MDCQERVGMQDNSPPLGEVALTARLVLVLLLLLSTSLSLSVSVGSEEPVPFQKSPPSLVRCAN